MLLRVPIKHCKNCGTAVVYRIPDDGDTLVGEITGLPSLTVQIV
jgi:hypothetical protein